MPISSSSRWWYRHFCRYRDGTCSVHRSAQITRELTQSAGRVPSSSSNGNDRGDGRASLHDSRAAALGVELTEREIAASPQCLSRSAHRLLRRVLFVHHAKRQWRWRPRRATMRVCSTIERTAESYLLFCLIIFIMNFTEPRKLWITIANEVNKLRKN